MPPSSRSGGFNWPSSFPWCWLGLGLSCSRTVAGSLPARSLGRSWCGCCPWLGCSASMSVSGIRTNGSSTARSRHCCLRAWDCGPSLHFRSAWPDVVLANDAGGNRRSGRGPSWPQPPSSSQRGSAVSTATRARIPGRRGTSGWGSPPSAATWRRTRRSDRWCSSSPSVRSRTTASCGEASGGETGASFARGSQPGSSRRPTCTSARSASSSRGDPPSPGIDWSISSAGPLTGRSESELRGRNRWFSWSSDSTDVSATTSTSVCHAPFLWVVACSPSMAERLPSRTRRR
jgi:hypothetical protein